MADKRCPLCDSTIERLQRDLSGADVWCVPGAPGAGFAPGSFVVLL